MQAVILDSGKGTRMGNLTKNRHKSMVEIEAGVPLVLYQLNTLFKAGIKEFIITTGYLAEPLEALIKKEFDEKDCSILFIRNQQYELTNYIFSLYLACGCIKGDILLLHGDLYFTPSMVKRLLGTKGSRVALDPKTEIPEKDFKAKVERGRILKISTDIFGENCYSSQPFYKIMENDWLLWKKEIIHFCEHGRTDVYAEEALNRTLDCLELWPFDLKGSLCMEIDTPEDLKHLKEQREKETAE